MPYPRLDTGSVLNPTPLDRDVGLLAIQSYMSVLAFGTLPVLVLQGRGKLNPGSSSRLWLFGFVLIWARRACPTARYQSQGQRKRAFSCSVSAQPREKVLESRGQVTISGAEPGACLLRTSKVCTYVCRYKQGQVAAAGKSESRPWIFGGGGSLSCSQPVP